MKGAWVIATGSLLLACESAPMLVDGGLRGSDSGTSPDAAPAVDGGRSIEPRDAGSPRDGGSVDAFVERDACTEVAFYRDADGDGFGDPAQERLACLAPDGFVARGGDCADDDRAIHPDARDLCDDRDDDCRDGAATCEGSAGRASGTYALRTVERVGTSVIHDIRCTGDGATMIDPSARPVLQGTFTCSYAGSVGGFARRQTASVEGELAPDGTITARLTHRFDSGVSRTFPVTGTWTASGTIALRASTTWRPHPMSAVPWELEIAFDGAR